MGILLNTPDPSTGLRYRSKHLGSFLFLGLVLVLLLEVRVLAADPLLTGEAFDMPGDGGGSIGLRWQGGFEETGEVHYQIVLSDREQGAFQPVATIPSNTHYGKDRAAPWWVIGTPQPRAHFFQISTVADHPLLDGTRYFVKIRVRVGDERFESPVFSAVPQPNWFQWAKLNNFLFMLAFSGGVLLLIRSARTKPTLFLRRIPGIDAIEEAIGRAAETGHPILYLTGSGELTGRGDASNMSTIAATVLLGEVAKRSAVSGTAITVPHRSPIVMAIAQDMVKDAYRTAGRLDAYADESNFFIAADQFAYTAAVDGIMLRERPAANFFIGYYYAESLLLAETGAATGAMQIAGTDAEHQLPFFVATCDYTLIGEELYAASAYLSRDPRAGRHAPRPGLGERLLARRSGGGNRTAHPRRGDWCDHLGDGRADISRFSLGRTGGRCVSGNKPCLS